MRMLEEELFNHCKVDDRDAKAVSGLLLQELENQVKSVCSRKDPTSLRR